MTALALTHLDAVTHLAVLDASQPGWSRWVENALGWKQEPLKIPVLALGGEQSYGPQIVAMLQEFAQEVTGGSTEGSGHWIPEERPVEVTEYLLHFLSK